MKIINKRIQNPFGLALMLSFCLFCFASCADEGMQGKGNTEDDKSSNRLMITAQGLNNLQTKATEEGTALERQYSSLHVYCFGSNNKLLFYKNSSVGFYPYSMVLPQDLGNYGQVTIYVFASPGDKVVMPTSPTVTELEKLTIPGMVSYNTRDTTLLYPSPRIVGAKIPMSKKMTHNFNTSKIAKVELLRSVAKLRIKIADKTQGKIILDTTQMSLELKDLHGGVVFFNKGTTDSGIKLFKSQKFNSTASEENINNVRWPYVAYVNEYLDTDLSRQPKIHINIPYKETDGSDYKQFKSLYEVPVDFPIKRNNIYQITLDVYGPGVENAHAVLIKLTKEDGKIGEQLSRISGKRINLEAHIPVSNQGRTFDCWSTAEKEKKCVHNPNSWRVPSNDTEIILYSHWK